MFRCVATCWMMLDQTFLCNILDVAWSCTRLATFTQHFCARACALGPLAIATRNVRVRQRPGAHKQRHVVMNVACVWPARSIAAATSCNNVARCCVEMLRAFGEALTIGHAVSSSKSSFNYWRAWEWEERVWGGWGEWVWATCKESLKHRKWASCIKFHILVQRIKKSVDIW